MAEAIRFYLDQHIPGPTAAGLRRRGVDTLTAQVASRCGLDDAEQLRFALSEKRVLVTFDPDFIELASNGVPHAGIAWCPATKYGIGQLIYALLLLHGVLDAEEMINHIEYL